MKKLFSLLIVALVSSQMWAYSYAYASFGSGCSSTMGNIFVSTSSTSFSSTSASNSNSTTYYWKAEAKSGYKFVGWYTSSTKPSSWTAYGASTSNPYSKFVSSSTTLYAFFEVDNSGSGGSGSGSGGGSSQTKNYSIGSTNYTMNAYDMGTNDNILWGDRALGASSNSGAGLYYQYGNTTASTGSASSSYSYSGIYTASNSLPADKDAATVALGEGWRMPTSTEYTTLISKTTISRTSSSANYATAVGNGNTIYFYYAGYKYNTSTSYASSSGNAYLWTSTKYSSSEAYRLNFSHTTSSPYVGTKSASGTNHTYFYYAQQVKPVYDNATYTLTVKADGTTSTTYPGKWGASTTSITASKSGYTFVRWDDGNTSNPRVFKICNATYTAVFEAQKVTATFKNYDGTTLYTNSNVTPGTTPTYSGADPTRPATQTESEVTTYTFTGWSPTLGNISTNTTYTAQFSSTTTPRTYTIRFLMDDGETVLSSAQVVYNGSPIEPAEPTKIGTEEYSYNFTGWEPAVTAVTGDQDYVAVFEQVAKAPKYDLTIGAFTNGSVTLTANGKTDVVPVAGGTYQYEEGTTIIVKAVPAKGYHFNQWNDANKAASRQVSEIAANMTLTPTFAVNTPFLMDDTWEQAAFISNCAAATGVLTVTLKDRTYSAGQWATLSVPFNCTLDQEDELYNAVYKLHTLTLAQDGGSVSFEFIRTNVVEANEPYLIVPRHDISTVVFHGVTLTTPAEVSRTTDDRVTFVSGLWKQTISGPNEFYVATGNSLRYASTLGTNVKGNRAFFRKIGDAASAPRRAIMVIDGEEVEVEIAGDAIEEVQDVRKYIENGVLIIERNGVRMDAQGKRIN
ncbi:MAG: InlB B-repeat-containing protein [Paludibacteraceae bacterium]|nr:InlB B-repeat-containing protein [Paludibacteraceae bacterium]